MCIYQIRCDPCVHYTQYAQHVHRSLRTIARSSALPLKRFFLGTFFYYKPEHWQAHFMASAKLALLTVCNHAGLMSHGNRHSELLVPTTVCITNEMDKDE